MLRFASQTFRCAGVVHATAIALLGAALLAAGGCGSSSSAGRDRRARDPAAVVPPDAAIFVNVNLQPRGDQRKAVDAVLGRLLGSAHSHEPLLAIVDRTLAARHTGFRYARDIKPWLGARVGLFVNSFAPPRRWALVLSVRDAAAARRALARLDAASGQLSQQSYGGVSYTLNPRGIAHALVRGFVVAGDEASVRSAILAAGGLSLGASSRYRDSRPFEQRQGLASVYIDPVGAVAALPSGIVPAGALRAAYLSLARLTPQKPYVFALSARHGTVALDFGDVPSQASGATPSAPASSAALLPQMPAQSWLGIYLPDLGRHLFETFDPKTHVGLPLDDIARLERRFTTATGLSLTRDVTPWLGSAGIFWEGTRTSSAGALVLQTLRPRLSSRALAKSRTFFTRRPGSHLRDVRVGGAAGFSARLPGHARPLALLAAGERVIVANDRRAARDALAARDRLSGVRAYRAGVTALGRNVVPAVWISPGRALATLRALGLTQPHWLRTAGPLIGRAAYLMFGTRRGVRRLVIGG